MPAEGTAARAGGIQPTLLPAASQRRALRSRPLRSASGTPAAAEAGAELGTAPAAPHETGVCSSRGCSSPSPPRRSAHKTQLEPRLLAGVRAEPGEGVSVEPFSVGSMGRTRLSNRRDPGFAVRARWRQLCRPGCSPRHGATSPACTRAGSSLVTSPGTAVSPWASRGAGALGTAGCAPAVLPQHVCSAGTVWSFPCTPRSGEDLNAEAPLD